MESLLLLAQAAPVLTDSTAIGLTIGQAIGLVSLVIGGLITALGLGWKFSNQMLSKVDQLNQSFSTKIDKMTGDIQETLRKEFKQLLESSEAKYDQSHAIFERRITNIEGMSAEFYTAKGVSLEKFKSIETRLDRLEE
jgi:hypothetical protein